jgi:hypothetical protein
MLCGQLCGGSIKYTGVGKFEACYVKKGAELACYYTLTQPWLGVFSPWGGEQILNYPQICKIILWKSHYGNSLFFTEFSLIWSKVEASL